MLYLSTELNIIPCGSRITQDLGANTFGGTLYLPTNYKSLFSRKISHFDFCKTFSDEDECLDILFKIQYGGRKCLKCGRSILDNYNRLLTKSAKNKPKKAFRCKSCHTAVFPIGNTIFRGSSVPLPTIFSILFEVVALKNSFAMTDLFSRNGIAYKTGHSMLKSVRWVMFDSPERKMSGNIEIDEAFFGSGGNKSYNWSGISTRKKPIIGMVCRETKEVRMFLVENRNAATITKLVQKNIEEGSTIYTDSWRGYQCMGKFNHHVVDHSKREFVRGDVHTNTMEGIWGKLKRNIRGAHIKINAEYVQLYVNEFCWKNNRRGKTSMELFNELLIRCMIRLG